MTQHINSTPGLIASQGLGIACAVGASFCFTLSDAGVKFLSGDYALHQIIFFRSLIALSITLLLFVPLEGGYRYLRTRFLKIHLARGLCVVFANLMFFSGLATLDLPEATSIFFVAPLLITALSVVFLGERVGVQRWVAVSIGMVGVLTIMRPGMDSFKGAAILPLLAACGYASLQILTRRIGFNDKASTMSFYVQLVFLAVCCLFGLLVGDGRFGNTGNPTLDFLFRAWKWPATQDLYVMLGLGVLNAMGAYMISQAYRQCEAAVVAPFEYTALLLSIVWSVLIWSVWPDSITWLGITLILAAGLFVFWREVVLNKLLAVKHPLPRNR